MQALSHVCHFTWLLQTATRLSSVMIPRILLQACLQEFFCLGLLEPYVFHISSTAVQFNHMPLGPNNKE